MAQLCTKCSRANPPEAIYCYFDGFVLGGHERRGGPISVGSQPFNSPFVFPTGRTCRSFDELALACQEEWTVACGLLKDGYLESFLGGLGRVDLALAAKEAARFPDSERGLDQLLEKLPSTVLDDPKLRVDPQEVSLGVLDSGKGRTFELELENTGMRLLYGTVSSSDAAWISLGEAGSTEKHFQITHDLKIPVHIKPERVRASSKPIEAKILIESNGGTATVILKAEKPVKPFPNGPLKGAKTPRQIAEQAMKAPKEVAPLFEAGEVERWYESNGWIYPVKIPAVAGIAAIQQFFEALGFSKAPKVEISDQSFSLQADPGESLVLMLEVKTQEKKAVWAHATSNVPWLEVSRAQCVSRTATINMSVPKVPNKPGEVLEGELTVIANGNKRWLVPVSVAVSGSLPPALVVDYEAPQPTSELDFTAPPPPRPKSSPDIPPPPAKKPSTPARRKPAGTPMLLHLIPAVLLGLLVVGVAGFDLVRGVLPKSEDFVDKGKPRIRIALNPEYRFGVVEVDPNNPTDQAAWKKLTASPGGDSNSTVIKIGKNHGGYIFGMRLPDAQFVGPRKKTLASGRGWETTIRYKREQILVTQRVETVPGRTGLFDTCLIQYSIHNENAKKPQTVSVRVMLDTYIGENDGVPFTIPGEKGFVDKRRLMADEAIPDYVEAVENGDDPNNPGTIARLSIKGLRVPGDKTLTEPDKVFIGRFPGSQSRWDIKEDDMKPAGQKGDSCVAVFWNDMKIEPKSTRYLALAYGLGELSLNDRLKVSVPTSVVPGREFYVTCYVYQAKKGDIVTLNLPDGLTFAGGDKAQKKVDDTAKRTQVFWKVRATREGTFNVSATSGEGKSSDTKVVVKIGSIFG